MTDRLEAIKKFRAELTEIGFTESDWARVSVADLDWLIGEVDRLTQPLDDGGHGHERGGYVVENLEPADVKEPLSLGPHPTGGYCPPGIKARTPHDHAACVAHW